MSWECQGRQEHGWFGSGTCGGGADGGIDAAAVAQVAYAAVGFLPVSQRGGYEGWLNRGGMGQLAATLPAWAAGADMTPEAFRETFFGAEGSAAVAARAHETGADLAAAMPGPAGDAARAWAGRPLAEMVQVVRPEALGRVMAVAQRRAAIAPARPRAAGPRRLTPAEQNVQDMAAIIHNEARGESNLAMIAVGHTVLNRMRRNGEAAVRGVWHAYDHRRVPLAPSIAAAREVLGGRTQDPTNGATHYYSPKSMAKEDDTPRGDTRGGLESVPGVQSDKTRLPARNYRPGWSLTFEPRAVVGVADADYKFFRQPDGNRRVR